MSSQQSVAPWGALNTSRSIATCGSVAAVMLIRTQFPPPSETGLSTVLRRLFATLATCDQPLVGGAAVPPGAEFTSIV